MTGRILITAAAITLGMACSTASPNRERGFLFRELRAAGRFDSFVLYVPRAYSEDRAWPLVVFLHGSGESGRDGSRQLTQGLVPELLRDPDRWPALVLLPQKPEIDSEWEQYEETLMAMIADVRGSFRIDPRRIALTGLSQGGHGALVLGARHPELWSSIAAVCGYGVARRGIDQPDLQPPYRGIIAELAEGLADRPVWLFHGDADDVVPTEQSQRLARAIEAAGGQVRLTVYPGVGHGAWHAAYGEPELSTFLLTPRQGSP